ncbi:MAG TPA: class I SAM-dependent methyltransferase [Bryobacteraceae bacterium]|nr:class I SAM-dependent methyltransferase [Bryobacteraceae bacterium]
MDRNSEELAAVVAELRQRVRARNPNGVVLGDIVLPDLTPLLHARDAAEAKVASIGTVNPRAPGLLNSIAQRVKRLIARALDWHVREQVEFNRAVMACVQSTLESLNESNRTMMALARSSAQSAQDLRDEARQLKDIRTHWAQWRVEWEQKLAANEIHFLRSVSELQASFQHRVTLMDADYRQQAKAQHSDFSATQKQAIEEIQQRLWADLEAIQKRLWEDMSRIRADYETIIHSELRLLRQRASLTHTAPAPDAPQASPQVPQIDWLKFAEKFRGSEEALQQRQRLYAGRFHDAAAVLDIGCGRGELLEVFRSAGIPARGIDQNDDAIALCGSKGLAVEKADLFEYLRALPDSSLTGVVCCQVVEHLPPESLAELIRLLHAKLRPAALLAIETPNPECLAIFATHFYLDPTHRHPIPSALLAFYLEEAGFGQIEVERLSPAVESIPSLADLPATFRHDFFDSLDYAIFARKL